MTNKSLKITFWTSTTLIFLFEGVMPALTSHTEMAKEGITSLGYPLYFGTILTVFKILGSVTLIVPQMPHRLKEWAYAGFAFDFIFAFLSLVIVYGFNGMAILPLAFMGVLAASYLSYHRLRANDPHTRPAREPSPRVAV